MVKLARVDNRSALIYPKQMMYKFQRKHQTNLCPHAREYLSQNNSTKQNWETVSACTKFEDLISLKERQYFKESL